MVVAVIRNYYELLVQHQHYKQVQHKHIVVVVDMHRVVVDMHRVPVDYS
jgi:hypothetical protein